VVRSVDWVDGAVRLIDQTVLPGEERWLEITEPDELVDAIRRLAVRGAPAIGAAGALGVALAARRAADRAPDGARSIGHRAVDRTVDRAVDRAAERAGDRAAERAGDRAAERAADPGADRAANGAVDRGADRADRAAGSAAHVAHVPAAAAAAPAAARQPAADGPAADGTTGHVGPSTAAGAAAAYEREVREAAARIRAARPTAVNLARGVDRALARLDEGPEAVIAEARNVVEEEAAACRGIAERGADLLRQDKPLRVLTHCNTGWLAGVERGTALGIVTVLHERGQVDRVYVDETRPLLQGARLTAWELATGGIDHRVVVDGAAASVIARGMVDVVVVGADRIAANGDVANKVGTYPLALAAARRGIPFVVAAPESTVDTSTPTGDDIEIEERDPQEVGDGPAYNPAFDVTPADLVTAIVTDRRTVRPARGETL
jgi:methylthioribose-1-phosphate isomerase